MLDHLRKFKRSVMGFIAVCFLGGLMATFGLNGPSKYAGRGRSEETPALVINGVKVTHDEYSLQVRNLDSMGRRQFGPNYDKIRAMMNVPGRVVDGLIAQNLFNGLIGELGLGAGISQVRDYIMQTYFPNGYNEQVYLELLRQSGMSEEAHEDRVRKQIAASQLQEMLNDISYASEAELKAKYRTDNTKFTFRYAALNSADFEAKVDTSDEAAVKKYYDEHKEQFKKGKSVRYTAVEFPAAEYASKVDVSGEDLQEAYEGAIKQFTEPRQVLVKRMVWSKEKATPSSLDEMMNPEKQDDSPASAEKRKKAEAALKRLKDGEDFDKVRSESSENPSGAGMIEEGKWLTVTGLDPKFRNAAQKLDKGQYSSILETDAGFFIIKIEDLKAQRVKPLEEVKADVEALVRKGLAPTYAVASAENFLNEWEKKSKDSEITLADYAASVGRKSVSDGKLYYDGEAPEGLPAALTSKAFLLGNGSRESVTVQSRVFVLDVEEVKAPFVPEFGEVKDAAVLAFKKDKARELAKAAAESLIKEAQAAPLSAGVSRLEPAAKKRGLEIKTTEEKTRSQALGQAPFESSQAVDAAFGLNDADPLLKDPIEAGSTSYVFELSAISLPDEGDWKNKKNELLKAELKRGGQALSQALLGNLKRHATIVDNTQAERAAAAGSAPIDVIEH